ncbi:hypothetical protein MTQ93_12295 [Staphylococcus agnetis]|uniref:hypothetical protein n=1 Tax=Staphylococcus agnetis TaxID=985762 RepID=UPI00208F0090|nr:hypothetical protein [Staphylococcus agnetis]MCO4346791.1 hypothetical protein [Staphylococcus agnetis]MCO4365832.1 hypothetical protein [Staphylococcus agnetis]
MSEQFENKFQKNLSEENKIKLDKEEKNRKKRAIPSYKTRKTIVIDEEVNELLDNLIYEEYFKNKKKLNKRRLANEIIKDYAARNYPHL